MSALADPNGPDRHIAWSSDAYANRPAEDRRPDNPAPAGEQDRAIRSDHLRIMTEHNPKHSAYGINAVAQVEWEQRVNDLNATARGLSEVMARDEATRKAFTARWNDVHAALNALLDNPPTPVEPWSHEHIRNATHPVEAERTYPTGHVCIVPNCKSTK